MSPNKPKKESYPNVYKNENEDDDETIQFLNTTVYSYPAGMLCRLSLRACRGALYYERKDTRQIY